MGKKNLIQWVCVAFASVIQVIINIICSLDLLLKTENPNDYSEGHQIRGDPDKVVSILTLQDKTKRSHFYPKPTEVSVQATKYDSCFLFLICALVSVCPRLFPRVLLFSKPTLG